MGDRKITDFKPVEILKHIQPAKYNYGQVDAGTEIDFKFRIKGLPVSAIGFARGCGCQGDYESY